eukprot:TRINITY_DN9955_c0_g1_i1.p1 TRINITY_DN9955_c0_g1~~TRINITY_DN9955_c0_g1_i1.p1  ORF type:complete len:257 (+),score=56.99 TRINITY_DN9955_c0_g1_i1:141-911(+)
MDGPKEPVTLNARVLRSLRCLGYPAPSSVHLRIVVLWLEEERIRLYSPSERHFLRHAATDHSMNTQTYVSQVLAKYFSDLHCPVSSSGTLASNIIASGVANLVRIATALHYHDNAQRLNRAGTLNFLSSVKNNDSSKKFDFSSQEYSHCILKLADAAGVPHHENPLILLRAIRRKIKSYHLAVQDQQNKNNVNESLENSAIGVNVSDDLKRIALVLRIVYIEDLKDLQLRINDAISELQQFTANPQVEAKLGKVGR